MTETAVIRNCRIVWSTQSGRAKACARRASRIIRERTGAEIATSGTSFDQCQPSFLDVVATDMPDDCLLVLFVSTTGDGEHCDSIRHTWKMLLQKSLPRTMLRDKQFAIYCLGDRAYGPQFCAAGRKLAVRLLQLGMTNRCEVGYGDDNTPNGGVFMDLDYWLDNHLIKALPSIPAGSSVTATSDNWAAFPTQDVPYEVQLAQDTAEYKSQGSDAIIEHPAFAKSFQAYFIEMCPATAYSYAYTSAGASSDTPGMLTNASAGAVKTTRRIANDNTDRNSTELPLCGTVLSNTRLTAPTWDQETRHIHINLRAAEAASSGANTNGDGDVTLPTYELPYQAGDIATVLPTNSDEEVQRFLDVLPSALRAVADRQIVITTKDQSENQSNNTVWPQSCTLRSWLKYCADIHSRPEREDLRSLGPFCSSQHPMGDGQREKLISLSETSESALFADYILREKRSWVDVLFDFNSLRHEHSNLTLGALMHLLPPMRPRDFSIASSPSWSKLKSGDHPNARATAAGTSDGFDIELCVAVVKGKTPLGRSYHGLCSEYLSRQNAPGDETPTAGNIYESDVQASAHRPSPLRVWIRPGSFQRLPTKLVPHAADDPHREPRRRFEVPVLYVGAGTGVAPLRSLILERQAIRQHGVSEAGAPPATPRDVPTSETQPTDILLFGCRRKTADYYYESEWQSLCESNQLRLMTAFSRDQVQKLYVQRVLRETDGGHFILQHLVQNKGAVYIAGGPKMARAVKDEIVEALKIASSGDERKANLFLAKLAKVGKFAIEAWS